MESRTRRAGRAAHRSGDPRLARLYSRYQGLLRRHLRLVPIPSETDDELLVRLVAVAGPSGAEAAGRFLERYRRARFDVRPSSSSSGGAQGPAACTPLEPPRDPFRELGLSLEELERAILSRRV